jgi:hypothetical protein
MTMARRYAVTPVGAWQYDGDKYDGNRIFFSLGRDFSRQTRFLAKNG